MAAQKRAKKSSKTKRAPARARAGKRTVRSAPRPRKTTRPTPRPAATPAGRTAPAPNSIGCVHQHLDFTSHAMDEVRRFYTEILGFSNFTHDPAFNYLNVNTGVGASIGFMPPMPGPPEQWRPPREPALYLMVEDVDRACRTLQAKGVVLQQDPTDMPWKHRVAILRDPEGRAIMLAQVIQTG